MDEPTDVKINADEALILRLFIEEHWMLFMNHAENYGFEEADCENLCSKMD